MNKFNLDNLPEMIKTSIKMEEPNQPIPVYSGIFNLNREGKAMRIDGTLVFEWFPSKQVRFIGDVVESEFPLDELIKLEQIYELEVNGLRVGDCRFSEMTLGENSKVQGILNHYALIGDKSIPVSKIRFSIPNLREFFGDPIKTSERGVSRSRLSFETEKYSINIDQLIKYKELKNKLKLKGGYIILHSGELIKKEGAIQYDDLIYLKYCLSSFLSFLNGRKVGVFFAQGIHEDEVIWTDFTPMYVELFKTVHSWPCKLSIEGLNESWKNFFEIWKLLDEEDFLNSAIHWYLEANSDSIIDNSIILTQIGLELVYNWFVIENKKMLIGKDAENISAANKIRLLLSQIGLKNELPIHFTELNSYLIQNNLPDGIEAFVQIRNTLVHSQEERRKKLSSVDPIVLYQVHELGLWYLELAILRVIDFRGKYCFRCSDKKWSGQNEISVPWI